MEGKEFYSARWSSKLLTFIVS